MNATYRVTMDLSPVWIGKNLFLTDNLHMIKRMIDACVEDAEFLHPNDLKDEYEASRECYLDSMPVMIRMCNSPKETAERLNAWYSDLAKIELIQDPRNLKS